ncbi:BadF/BadG/BcrA/BcrD ATPase family protein [Phaeovulum vinaykumarii]|uniref:Glucosamine kinase n=1 Tax=Phaeovulum vinaykumarii TaxID=407234 RepID=A0A1N7KRG7_9RHOB|nr:BadF/BadG/BcrA/BcrD ATPase family protein [Phaeovulum vinaykumarii]SIS64151.1 glucosamine kinase [Phaeovulum vinaykumarii]SOC01663.1 glucosamine kinase [Phaeovulum vinaykumarii]
MLALGVDGGGSGCRAVLADAAGRVLAEASAGPANIATDPVGARSAVAAAVRGVLGGRPPEDVVAVFGLAGANIPSAVRAFGELPFARSRIVWDALTAARGALADTDGIVAALGTGAVYVAQEGADLRALGGWGFALGDEGSAAWMGRAFCAGALRGLDGRQPLSPLEKALLAEFGGGAGLVSLAANATPADYANLARRLLTAPDDPCALRLFDAAQVEIEAAIAHLQNRGETLPVVLTGGLGPYFTRRLSRRWKIVSPQGTPLDGALSMALEFLMR